MLDYAMLCYAMMSTGTSRDRARVRAASPRVGPQPPVARTKSASEHGSMSTLAHSTGRSYLAWCVRVRACVRVCERERECVCEREGGGCVWGVGGGVRSCLVRLGVGREREAAKEGRGEQGGASGPRGVE